MSVSPPRAVIVGSKVCRGWTLERVPTIFIVLVSERGDAFLFCLWSPSSRTAAHVAPPPSFSASPVSQHRVPPHGREGNIGEGTKRARRQIVLEGHVGLGLGCQGVLVPWSVEPACTNGRKGCFFSFFFSESWVSAHHCSACAKRAFVAAGVLLGAP